MIDLVTALGLMLVLEGALYALFPEGVKTMMGQIIRLPQQYLRVGGLFFACFGFLVVAVVKGH
jgi:uncharacterized protein YjeT (DUF2065 family)